MFKAVLFLLAAAGGTLVAIWLGVMVFFIANMLIGSFCRDAWYCALQQPLSMLAIFLCVCSPLLGAGLAGVLLAASSRPPKAPAPARPHAPNHSDS